MQKRSISGKLTQLSNLPLPQWAAFISAWWHRGQRGIVPCVLSGTDRMIEIPLREFYETYWFFCESRQGIREMTFFLEKLGSGDVIYDIGAFRGAYGAGAKAKFGETVGVHLFEPIQSNYEAIRAIKMLNRLERFEVVPKAVGRGDTIHGMLHGGDAMLRQGDSAEGLVAVEFPSTSVDAYMAESGVPPTVMKVDVEGFELDVLEGARNCLTIHHPRLWIELHPSFLEAQGRRWEDVTDLLKAIGYGTLTFFEDFDMPTRSVAFHLWCEQ